MKNAVIFDFDGVIVTTDEYHYQAWKRLADEEGIPFDRDVNEFLRGVSRMESLEIILENTGKTFSAAEKEDMCMRKNGYYRGFLDGLSPADILPGVREVLRELKVRGVRVAIGSSSKNTPVILEKIGLSGFFGAVADGNMITHSKPDPEVFLLAAGLMGKAPADCVVVEDAAAGVEAALNAGMRVVGVGSARHDERAHYRVPDLSAADVDMILG